MPQPIDDTLSAHNTPSRFSKKRVKRVTDGTEQRKNKRLVRFCHININRLKLTPVDRSGDYLGQLLLQVTVRFNSSFTWFGIEHFLEFPALFKWEGGGGLFLSCLKHMTPIRLPPFTRNTQRLLSVRTSAPHPTITAICPKCSRNLVGRHILSIRRLNGMSCANWNINFTITLSASH